MWTKDERENKALARNTAIGAWQNKKSVLFLPGRDQVDVKQCLANGSVNRNTVVHLVEREKDVYARIEEWGRTYPWPERLRVFNSPLHMTAPSPLDGAFFDLYGNLSVSEALWLRNHCLLTAGADVAFTFSFATRHNSFIPHCEYALVESFAALLAQKTRRLVGFPQDMKRFIGTYLVLLEDVIYPEFDFATEVYYYKEANTVNTMVLFVLPNMQPNHKSPDETLYQALLESQMTAKERSYAAHKAWATRRAKQIEHAPVPELTPAQKAWETRRANEVKKKRSAAAHKAWATRRAKQLA